MNRCQKHKKLVWECDEKEAGKQKNLSVRDEMCPKMLSEQKTTTRRHIRDKNRRKNWGVMIQTGLASRVSRDWLPINPLCLWHTVCSYRSKPFSGTQTKDVPLSFRSVFVSWHTSLLRLLLQKKGKMHYQIAVIINFLGHCISMVALLVAFFLFLCLRWVFFLFFVAAASPTDNPADILDMTGSISALKIPRSGAPLVLIGKNHLVMGWSIPYLNPADVKEGRGS